MASGSDNVESFEEETSLMAAGGEEGTFPKELSARYKIFNDCVHGYIRVHPVCVKIIDTPEFQRLRNLKQVGFVYWVYPGASHNRFEHSLGVCHLAGKMVEALRRNCDDENIISYEEKLCLEIAGLCHDLGHGPFSHTWERFVEAATSENGESEKWKHEESSVQMFEYLLEKNGLYSEVVESFPNLKNKAIEFIKELIRGEGKLKKDKKYLYQIISNKENGIDVDRWDYILRDSRQINFSFSFNYSRMLELCRVVEVDGEKIICFRNIERHNIYDLFHVRVNLYFKAMYHKVAMVVEEMIIDAFIEADKNGYIIHDSDGKKYPLSKAQGDPKALSCMTDHIFYDILYSTDTKFEGAKKLLRRILRRDLYKFVAWRDFSTELLIEKKKLKEAGADNQELGMRASNQIELYEKDIKEDIKDICKDMKHCKFEQFKVLKTLLDMSVEIKGASTCTTEKINPFKNIFFYKKKNLEHAEKMKWKDIPVLPVPEESMCHIHFLVIYKDVENPDSKNEELQELQDFKTKLQNLWQQESTPAKKSKL